MAREKQTRLQLSSCKRAYCFVFLASDRNHIHDPRKGIAGEEFPTLLIPPLTDHDVAIDNIPNKGDEIIGALLNVNERAKRDNANVHEDLDYE